MEITHKGMGKMKQNLLLLMIALTLVGCAPTTTPSPTLPNTGTNPPP